MKSSTSKFISKSLLLTQLFLLTSGLIPAPMARAFISNGANAIDVLGQYSNAPDAGLLPYYGKGEVNDGPNELGFTNTAIIEFDNVGHRLFVADTFRVLVYNLNNDNTFPDKIADAVLGQPDFLTLNFSTINQSSLGGTIGGLLYEPTAQRLFVADGQRNRVLVFDLSDGITNEENAVNVLGQTDFTSSGAATTQAGMRNPAGMDYDPVGQRLFVANDQVTASRVTVYDLSDGITDGENAVNVLGQPNFTTGTNSPTTSSRMSSPEDVAYNAGRLYVSDTNNHRVLVFNLSDGITNGESAINVLGTNSFNSSTGALTQLGLMNPSSLVFDNNLLYVAQGNGGRRISIFDVTAITNGENAVNVLGQPDFVTSNNTFTQQGPVGRSIAMDTINNLLYAEATYRVMAFDISTITNGENAVDLLGQYDDDLNLDYTKSKQNNGPNKWGYAFNIFPATNGVFDNNNHRYFLSDGTNNRVLVYNLNNDNSFPDKLPDAVLGQTNFSTFGSNITANGLTEPSALAYDHNNDHLFVLDNMGAGRILVYDASGVITNNQSAINVLGQPNFTSNVSTISQSGLNSVSGITYDENRDYLFVGNNAANRVLIYDLSDGITDGEPAINILGQADFITGTSATSQTSTRDPVGLAYDNNNNRLFVAQCSANRVSVFDLATITDNEPAIAVIGQANYTNSTAATSSTRLSCPLDVSYDHQNDRVFVVDNSNDRVLSFMANQLSQFLTAATYVLGQSLFTTSTTDTSQSKFDTPVGLSYDALGQILYVTDGRNTRVMAFDVELPLVINFTDDVEAGPVGADAITVDVVANFPLTNLQYKIIANPVCNSTNYGALNGTVFNSGDQIINQTNPTENGNYVCVYASDNQGNVAYKGSLNDFNITADAISPIIAEVTPVPTPDNDTTPDYTFSSDEAGDITYGGACSSIITAAAIGNNTVTFDALVEGIYTDCTVMVTDASLNDSNILNISDFTIDLTAPVTAEITPVVTPAADTTPDYTFSSDEVGDITYGGDCSSVTAAAIIGNNTITFNALAPGIHNNCTITITDEAGNASILLNVTSFEITLAPDVTAPIIAEIIPVTTPSTNTNPSYTFSSDEAGSITYGGSCSSPTTLASIGNNTITFNTLAVGTYSNCTITVTDAATNVSNLLNISSFTINNPPTPPSGGGGGAGGTFGQPPSSGGVPQTPTPTEPSQPTEPTQPPEPTTPTQPTEPQQPSNPQTPTNPENPTQPPAEPTPVQPTEPQQPVQPSTPTQPDFENLDLESEEIIFVTQPTEIINTNTGAGIYDRKINKTTQQLSLTCNYSEFAGQYGLAITQNSDSDGDGLSDQLECLAQTDPTNSDTDGDGLSDAYEELTLGTNPRESNGEPDDNFLTIITPEEDMLTGDETPLVKGINTLKENVDIYIFDRADFDEFSEQLKSELDADENLNDQQRAELYSEKFTDYVQSILSKFINETLDEENAEEAKFINRIQLLGEAPTGSNSVFLLDSEKTLVDNTYLAVANSKELFSKEVEFKVDSTLKVLNPEVKTLGSKPIPAEALIGNLKIEIDPGNFRPVLAGNIKEPSKIIANWQSDVVSSALIADSLDEQFRLSAPSDLEPGEHTVYVTAYRRSDGAQSETLKIPFTVSADGTIIVRDSGTAWWIYLLAGLGIIILGGIIYQTTRPKPSRPQIL